MVMSKRTDSTVDVSMEAFDAVIADLQRQGVVSTVIVATLAETAIKTVVAEKDHAQMHLDALAAITRAAADAHRAGTVINGAQAIFADA